MTELHLFTGTSVIPDRGIILLRAGVLLVGPFFSGSVRCGNRNQIWDRS